MLHASGFEKIAAQSAVAFTLSRTTTEAEIDRAIAIVTESTHALHKLYCRLPLISKTGESTPL